jgi:hypothetical protein
MKDIVRGAAALAAAALIAVTIGTLVVNDPISTATGTGLGPVDTTPALAAPPTAAVAAPAVAPPALPPTTATDLADHLDQSLAGLGGSVPTDVVAPPPPVAPPATGGAAGPGSAAETGPDRLTIVSPTLQLLAFGGQIGMPLLCSLAAGSLGPALSDPGVSAVVGQIQTACVAMANQGADQLRALDDGLTALAAVDPAARAALDGLASALDAAAATDAPFARYFLQISALVRFFYA